MRVLFLSLLLFCFGVSNSFAESFVIKSISFSGLQRISESTVMNYLALKEGDRLGDEQATEAIHRLFSQGFFSDIEFIRTKDDGLLIELVERPSIAKIDISGNSEISTEDLKTSLKKIGLHEGRVFNRSVLEKLELELERQYFALGNYGVTVKSDILPQPRNRVAVEIKIDEGDVARIRQINIIGNEQYDDDRLLSVFQSGIYKDGKMFPSSSQYSRQKLAADLEQLKSFYLDRGYINFRINSTQVSITPDKKAVYITVNISEGDAYTVESVTLGGKLILSREELMKFVKIKPGDVFSRKAIAETNDAIIERLGEEGYAYANVTPLPTENEEKKTISLRLDIDPHKRVYVRRVVFEGNKKTHDEVLRREMRQLEGGFFSTAKLNRSKIRLQRTGFFDEINVQTPQVPGKLDQVDVIVSVTERPSGSVSASMGYSQAAKLILTASINENNFLGTGQQVAAQVNTDKVNTVYSFSLTDPYFTVDGISRGFRLYSRKTSANQAINIANYTADVYGASISFGIPLSEYRFARLGLEYDNTYVKLENAYDVDGSSELNNFLSAYGANYKYNADTDRSSAGFDAFKVTGSWSFDTRNKVIFPDSGHYATISTELAVPGGTLTYYKTSYRHQWFIPVFSGTSLKMEMQLGYGHGYQDTPVLPFYEHYYAGGGQSVRGFQENSLGPIRRSNGERTGGNKKTLGTTELYLPNPFSEESKNMRLGLFMDAGNVYASGEAFDYRQLRASYGISFIWITPVGALRFSQAWPLRTFDNDQLEGFQFSIGAPF